MEGGGLGASMMLERAQECLVDGGKKKAVMVVGTYRVVRCSSDSRSKQASCSRMGTRASRERRATNG